MATKISGNKGGSGASNEIRALTEAVKSLASSIGSVEGSHKIEFKIEGNKDVENINKELSGIKQYNQKNPKKYFQSIGNAQNSLIEQWNKLVQNQDLLSKWKNGEVDDKGFFKDSSKDVSELWKRANAFEALGGDIQKINPEMAEFVTRIREIYEGLDKNSKGGLPQTVDAFKELFGLLKQIPQEALEQAGFKGLTEDLNKAKIEALSLKDALDNIQKTNKGSSNNGNGSGNGNGDGNGTGPGDGSGNTSSTPDKIIAKTREEIKKLADEKRKLREQADRDSYWGLDFDELDDIQKLQEELKRLKEIRDDYLSSAEWRSERAANKSEQYGIDSNEVKQEQILYENAFDSYQQYANQVDYIQELLDKAVMNFDPSKISGDYAEAFGVLIALVQKLTTELEALSHLDIKTPFTELIDTLDKIEVGIGYLASTDTFGSFNVIKENLGEIKTLANDIKNIDFSKGFDGLNETLTTLHEKIAELGDFKSIFKGNNSVVQAQKEGEIKRRFVPQIEEAYNSLERYLYRDIYNEKGEIVESRFKGNIVSSNVDLFNEYIAHNEQSPGKSLQNTIDYFKNGISIIQQLLKGAGVDISAWESQFGEIFKNYRNEIKTLEKEATPINNLLDTIKQVFSGKEMQDNQFSDFAETLNKIIPSLTEAINQIKKITDSTGEALDFSNESTQISSLFDAIIKVTGAVNDKTEAFEKENSTVEEVIYNEVTFIEQLREELVAITDLLNQLNVDFTTLSNIDFSSLVKSMEIQQQIENTKKAEEEKETNKKKRDSKDLTDEERISEIGHKAILQAIAADERNFDQYSRKNQYYTQDRFGNISKYHVDHEDTDEHGNKRKWRTDYKYDPISQSVQRTVVSGIEDAVNNSFELAQKALNKKYSLLERNVTNPAKDNTTATQRMYEEQEVEDELNKQILNLTDNEKEALEKIRQSKEEQLNTLKESKKQDDQEKHYAELKAEVAKKKAAEEKQRRKEEKELDKEIEREEKEESKKKREKERKEEKDKKQSYKDEQQLIKESASLAEKSLKVNADESFDNIISKIQEKYNKRQTLLNDRKSTDIILDSQMEKAIESASERYAGKVSDIVDKTIGKKKTFNELFNNNKIINTDQYKTQLDELDQTITTLQNKLKNGIDITNPQEIKEIGELVHQVQNLENELGDKKNIKASEKNTTALQKRISNLITNNPKMGEEGKQYLQEISDGLKNVNQASLEHAIAQVNSFEQELNKAGKVGDTFSTKLVRKFKDLGAYFLSYVSIQDFIRYAREGFEIIHQLDDALTEMAKVSDEPLSRLKEFQTESYDIANQAGTTGLVIQQSTADWMRLGETLDDAKESAKDASVLLNVSEFESIDEATESLVAMSQAYDNLGKMDIIDKLNNVGNNFSISTDGLATALQLSASSLKTAGKKKCLIA